MHAFFAYPHQRQKYKLRWRNRGSYILATKNQVIILKVTWFSRLPSPQLKYSDSQGQYFSCARQWNVVSDRYHWRWIHPGTHITNFTCILFTTKNALPYSHHLCSTHFQTTYHTPRKHRWKEGLEVLVTKISFTSTKYQKKKKYKPEQNGETWTESN
jgi:hypothetical protein